MSKAVAYHNERVVETHGSSSRYDSSSTELQSCDALPRDLPFNDVQRFAKSHRLTHHQDVLQKAALILQGQIPVENIPGLTASEIQALKHETERKWRQPKMLYFTIIVCSIGAIEQGWTQTGMNGANLYFPKAFGIGSSSKHDNFIVGLINSGIYLSTGLL